MQLSSSVPSAHGYLRSTFGYIWGKIRSRFMAENPVVPPDHNVHEESINKMSKFPVSMREFCEERNYIIPKAVAIGPYHHGLSQLQEMEDVKEEAARFFFPETNVLQQRQIDMFPIALNARNMCYDTNELRGIRDDTFASIMFHDACFLLLIILAVTKPAVTLPIHCTSLLRKITANRNVLLRDIFLLENQIPWIVLKPLLDMQQPQVDLRTFIVKMGMNVQSHHHNQTPPDLGGHSPPHLLGLFHFYQSDDQLTCIAQAPYTPPETCLTSIIELAEIGITLVRSKTKTMKLKDIGLKRRMIFFRKLFLPSLNLNERTACWLLNMAAFETCMASHDSTVSSYLALFAMLMDREDDVHELRSKHLIHGEFADKQVLDFFKGRQASNICPGNKFYEILTNLHNYRERRWFRIAIHRLWYNYIKAFLTLLSAIGILVAILKATPLLKWTR